MIKYKYNFKKGSIQDYMIKNGILKKDLCLNWFNQIVSALKHLHLLKCSHRELKLSYVFLI